ncbi:hypothetical protein [Glaciecola sp. 1036]|uniref:hypothetical protein n=1 Tax=Alteromonadaceae TaxID=72275 RepID=UPI003CFF1847
MIILRSALFYIVIQILTYSSITAAQIVIPEANKRTKSGEQLSLFSNQACGPRIGAFISFLSKRTVDDAKAEVLDYAKDSIPLLVKQCSKATHITYIIGANSREHRGRFFQLTFQKNGSWQQKELLDSLDISKTLRDKGFMLSRGPARISPFTAISWHEKSLLGFFDKHFTSTFIATNVEPILSQSDPTKVQHYVLRGMWYGIGFSTDKTECDSSLHGYPIWGGFTAQISPNNRDINMQRWSCSVSSGSTQSKRVSLNAYYGSSTLPHNFTAIDTGSELAKLIALDVDENLINSDSVETSKTYLYTSDRLRIYFIESDLCDSRNLIAEYRVNHEYRNREFGGNYIRTISKIAFDEIAKRCEDVKSLRIKNYSYGDANEWDSFAVRKGVDRLTGIKDIDENLRIDDRKLSKQALEFEQKIQRQLLGPECENAAFCDLPGGRFLNAIYRSDMDAIYQMAYLHKVEFDGQDLSVFSGVLEHVLPGVTEYNKFQSHLLKRVANKYLHTYQNWNDMCFEEDAQSMKYEYVEPIVIDDEGFQSGGERYEATYTLNPNLFALRDKIADHYGAPSTDNPYLVASEKMVYTGIAEMKKRYDCNSQVVKTFESNLSSLINWLIKDPKVIKPNHENMPPTPNRVLKAAFDNEPIQQNDLKTKADEAPPPIELSVLM